LIAALAKLGREKTRREKDRSCSQSGIDLKSTARQLEFEASIDHV